MDAFVRGGGVRPVRYALGVGLALACSSSISTILCPALGVILTSFTMPINAIRSRLGTPFSRCSGNEFRSSMRFLSMLLRFSNLSLK